MYDELDHYLAMDTAGIKQYAGGAGLNNRIHDWLATPEGTVADDPGWGHPLRPLWHDPQSPTLSLQIEMAIVRKLPADVRDVRIRRIGVAFTAIDRCAVEVVHDLGTYQDEITLGEDASRGTI